MFKKMPQFVRDARAAKRKAEIVSGVRTDARFVEKAIPNTRRKKVDKVACREMCDRFLFCAILYDMKDVFEKKEFIKALTDISEQLITQFRTSAGARRAAIEFVQAYESGVIERTPFQEDSYRTTLKVLQQLEEEDVIKHGWKTSPAPGTQVVISDLPSAENDLLRENSVEDEAGNFFEANKRWAEQERMVAKFESITEMDWKGLKSQETFGLLQPVVPSTSFTRSIRLPLPNGSYMVALNRIEQREINSEEIPALEGEESVEIQQNDVHVSVSLQDENAMTIPVPIGAQIVACDGDEAILVGIDGRVPLVIQNLDVPVITGYVLRVAENGSAHTQADRKCFIPSNDEKEYWAKVLPLPKSIVERCEKQRERIPLFIAEFIADNFMYVCHDEYGEFLKKHEDDLPLIMDELRMGHCNLLSWVSTAYLRQLGVPCFLTNELVTNEKGSGFYLHSGHARVGVINTHGEVDIFDPTKVCRNPSALSPDHLSGQCFQQMDQIYAGAKSEDEKREILRAFISTFKQQMVETQTRLNRAQLQPQRHGPSNINELKNIFSELLQREPAVIFPERIIRKKFGDEYRGKVDDIGSWIRYAEHEIFLNGVISDGCFTAEQECDFFTDLAAKRERSFAATYVDAYARNGLHPFNWGQAGAYDTLLCDGFVDFPHLDISGVIFYFLQFYLNNEYTRKIAPKEFAEILKFSRSPDAFRIFFRKYKVPPETFFEQFTHVRFTDAAYSFYIGHEDFQFSDNFIEILKTIYVSDNWNTAFYEETLRRKRIIPLFENLIFTQLGARALNNKHLRAELSRRCGDYVDDNFWKKFAAQLQKTTHGKPKRELQDSSMLKKFSFETKQISNSFRVDIVRSREVTYIPREEERAARNAVKSLFIKLLQRKSPRPAERDFDSLEEYQPGHHDVRDIAWAASAHGDRVLAKRYKTDRVSGQPLHVVFDGLFSHPNQEEISFNIFQNVKIVLDVLSEIQKKTHAPIFVSSPNHGVYLKFDGLIHRSDIVASLITASTNYKESEVDLRKVKNGRAEIPENLVYLSHNQGKVAAVKYQLGNQVTALTYEELGCNVFARIKPEWVERGTEESSY